MSEPIMKPDPSSMSTTSDDGYWEFVDGQWLATEKQLNSQKEKPGDIESKELEAPIFNKNILPLFPFVIALLIYSLFSNSWYSADLFEKETWGSDDERLLGQINIGLNEAELVSAENSEEVTTSSFAEGCEETSTSLEEESCDSILFGKNNIIIIFKYIDIHA